GSCSDPRMYSGCTAAASMPRCAARSGRAMTSLRGGRVAVDEVGLLDEAAEELAHVERLEAARAGVRADREQEPLARELGAQGLAQGERRIERVVGVAADAADVDDQHVVAAAQRLERGEPQTEPAVVDVRHAVEDRGDARLEPGCDDLARVAVQR